MPTPYLLELQLLSEEELKKFEDEMRADMQEGSSYAAVGLKLLEIIDKLAQDNKNLATPYHQVRKENERLMAAMRSAVDRWGKTNLVSGNLELRLLEAGIAAWKILNAALAENAGEQAVKPDEQSDGRELATKPEGLNSGVELIDGKPVLWYKGACSECGVHSGAQEFREQVVEWWRVHINGNPANFLHNENAHCVIEKTLFRGGTVNNGERLPSTVVTPSDSGILTVTAGGHNYPYDGGTSDCSYHCGAWMGPARSGAPNGVDAFRICPNNPLICPNCKGEGRVLDVDSEIDTIACDHCEGTGLRHSDISVDGTEERILNIITELEKTYVDGVDFEEILDRAERRFGMDRGVAEEVVNILQDKGIVYEPIIGKIRRTT